MRSPFIVDLGINSFCASQNMQLQETAVSKACYSFDMFACVVVMEILQVFMATPPFHAGEG